MTNPSPFLDCYDVKTLSFKMSIQAMEETERQYAEQRAAQANPFYNVFGRAQQQQQAERQARRRAGGRSPGAKADGGPIIDVEYSTVDDD